MKLILKKCSLLLFLTLFVIFWGCGNQTTSESKPEKKLETFMNTLFTEQLSSNALTLHYTLKHPENYGITVNAPSLGRFDPDSLANDKKNVTACLHALEKIETDHLSLEWKFHYDTLHDYLSRCVEGYNYLFFEEPLSPTTGIQAQLPVLLSEYSFYNQKDIDTYLSLLSDVPDYFNSLLAYEDKKGQLGRFMADFAVKDIVEQCTSFLSQENNFLLASFEKRLDELPGLKASDRQHYIALNKVCLENDVLPAYQKLIDGLLSLSKKYSCAKGGLYYLKGGSDYYSYLIKKTVGTDRSFAEMSNLLSYYFEKDLEEMKTLVDTCPSLQTSCSAFTTKATPEQMLAQLEQSMLSDFPAPVKASCTVKYVDTSMEEYLSPAFYLTPPIDDASSNVIYINNGRKKNAFDLYTTLAHEGYPGHLYQNTMAASYNLPPIRSLLYYGGYTEGWATYVEMYSYGFSGIDKNTSQYLRIENCLNLYLYARLDLGIHGEGWQLADVQRFLQSFGIKDPNACQSIYEYIIEEPANYLKYGIGYLEFRSLQDYAIANLKEKYNAKEFHSFLLRSGAAPFPLLEKYFQKMYLSS